MTRTASSLLVRTTAVCALVVLMLAAACTVSTAPQNTALTPQAVSGILLPTSTQFPLPPSITPLFSGGNMTPVPFGAQLPAGLASAATPVPAGNIGAQSAPTAIAGGLGAQAAQPTATTNLATAAAIATGLALGTRVPTAIPATANPGSVTVTIPVGQIADTTQNIFQVLLNAASTVLATLWNLAGRFGGQVGQVLLCIGPAFFLAGYVVSRNRRFRRRRD
jgi:hypothetical protein